MPPTLPPSTRADATGSDGEHGDGAADGAFLRRLLSASPDCVKVLDLDGRLLSMSRAGQLALEIDDLTPHLGTCWTDWWLGADRDAAAAAVAAAAAGGTGRFEATALTATGKAKWWDVTVTPIPGTDGQPERLLSVSRDVTALRAARDAAAERLDRLRSVVDSATDYAVISVDPAGTIDGWSTGAVATFGHAEAEAVGRPFDLIWTPEDRAAGSPGQELAAAERDGVAPDNRWHVRADGRQIFVVGSTRPVRNAAGGLTGYVKVCRDETGARAADDELADARRRLDAALSGGRVATWVWEVGPDRLYADRNMRAFFDLPADDGAGLPVAAYVEALHPADRLAVTAALGR
ncbi:MAG: hypothetical protein JWO31_2079, partial [Phycisphaerales bacterium]|nr:hypothetical protein [Phycisphaerales bacterium]